MLQQVEPCPCPHPPSNCNPLLVLDHPPTHLFYVTPPRHPHPHTHTFHSQPTHTSILSPSTLRSRYRDPSFYLSHMPEENDPGEKFYGLGDGGFGEAVLDITGEDAGVFGWVVDGGWGGGQARANAAEGCRRHVLRSRGVGFVHQARALVMPMHTVHAPESVGR